jgi:5-formyltetrahydrofolate cyclo-ligase
MTTKKALRQAMLAKRKALSVRYREQASQQICTRLWQRLERLSAQTLLFYMPIQGEVDLRRAIHIGWQKGRRIILPRAMEGHQLACYQVEHGGQLQRGAYQIMEPDPQKAQLIDPLTIELAFIPGVAFDRQCYRLGYGGGYYDRFLQKYPHIQTWGIAYEEQMVPTIFPEAHDQPLQLVLTEKDRYTKPSLS